MFIYIHIVCYVRKQSKQIVSMHEALTLYWAHGILNIRLGIIYELDGNTMMVFIKAKHLLSAPRRKRQKKPHAICAYICKFQI